METEQFNLRLSKKLLRDIGMISNLLKVSKSDWVRMKLAEEVNEEKNTLLMKLSTLYGEGMINKKEVEKLVGKSVAEEMEFVKRKSEISLKKGLDYGRKFKK